MDYRWILFGLIWSVNISPPPPGLTPQVKGGVCRGRQSSTASYLSTAPYKSSLSCRATATQSDPII